MSGTRGRRTTSARSNRAQVSWARIRADIRLRVLGLASPRVRHLPGQHDQDKHAGKGGFDDIPAVGTPAWYAMLRKEEERDADREYYGVSPDYDDDTATGERADDVGLDPYDVQAAYEGVYAGFAVTGRAYVDADTVVWEGRIETPSGTGKVKRTFHRDRAGDLVVTHALLQLPAGVRGQGFATAFNAAAEQFYRANGVHRIELEANIDVGGYAWARAGFDWQDLNSLDVVLGRVADVAEQFRRQARDVRDTDPDLADRLDRAAQEAEKLADRDDLTPYEVSEIGREFAVPAGSVAHLPRLAQLDPDAVTAEPHTWLGREALLGSSWNGKMEL